MKPTDTTTKETRRKQPKIHNRVPRQITTIYVIWEKPKQRRSHTKQTKK